MRRARVRALTETPTKNQILQARIAVALIVGMAILGVAMYGVSRNDLARIWHDLAARPGGPMTFRFILQPAMAFIAALRDGVHDARTGRQAYLSAIVTGAEGRSVRLWEGIISTARILILGVAMDVIYQLAFLGTFFPGESALIAILLAFVPYALLRGPIARVARRWVAKPAPLNLTPPGADHGA
jgi:hypothetical protein